MPSSKARVPVPSFESDRPLEGAAPETPHWPGRSWPIHSPSMQVSKLSPLRSYTAPPPLPSTWWENTVSRGGAGGCQEPDTDADIRRLFPEVGACGTFNNACNDLAVNQRLLRRRLHDTLGMLTYWQTAVDDCQSSSLQRAGACVGYREAIAAVTAQIIALQTLRSNAPPMAQLLIDEQIGPLNTRVRDLNSERMACDAAILYNRTSSLPAHIVSQECAGRQQVVDRLLVERDWIGSFYNDYRRQLRDAEGWLNLFAGTCGACNSNDRAFARPCGELSYPARVRPYLTP